MKNNPKKTTRRYDAVMFDFDGTLVDTLQAMVSILEEVMPAFGIDPRDNSHPDIRKLLGPPWPEVFVSEEWNLLPEEAQRLSDVYHARYAEIPVQQTTMPFSGIPELLDRLGEEGTIRIVASSKDESILIRLLDELGFSQKFELVCGGTESNGRSKEAAIAKGLKHVQEARCRNAIMVGDRKYDIDAAHELGMECIGVDFNDFMADELEEHGALLIAKNVSELEKALLA